MKYIEKTIAWVFKLLQVIIWKNNQICSIHLAIIG